MASEKSVSDVCILPATRLPETPIDAKVVRFSVLNGKRLFIQTADGRLYHAAVRSEYQWIMDSTEPGSHRALIRLGVLDRKPIEAWKKRIREHQKQRQATDDIARLSRMLAKHNISLTKAQMKQLRLTNARSRDKKLPAASV